MVFLKRYRNVPTLVCEKCHGSHVKYLKEHVYQCLDCSHVSYIVWGLGFGKELFSEYNMMKDYENFIRTKYLKSFLSLGKNDVFLDAGCAFGYFTCYAAMIVKEAVGIDIEPWRLKRAEETKKELNLKNVSFRHANIYRIPYPDNYFDKVLCAEVLEHTLRPDKAIAELARVCRGVLAIQVPTTNLFRNVGEKVFGSTITESESMKESQLESLVHVQRFNAKRLCALISSCGLAVTDVAGAKLVSLNLISDNRFLVNFEYFCDSVFGVRFPFSNFGLMTIIRSAKL